MATKQKKKRIKPVLQKLGVFRAQEPLLSVIMWGVHHTVTELSMVQVPVMLMPDDFKAFTKIQVKNHLFNKNNKPGFFGFKEYSPLVFRNLRERFGIDEEDYMNSISKDDLRDMDSSGRSGSRFIVTADKKFIVKTISNEEVDVLHRILKDYHHYIVEQHGHSLLPQFLGMYKAVTNDTETHFFITNNIFHPLYNIHLKYDLKGSMVDRQASEKEKSKDLPTFKDRDFMRDRCKVYLDESDKQKLLEMLERDTNFLSRLHLMDYSLLVGIHDHNHPSNFEDDDDEEEDGDDNDEGDDDDTLLIDDNDVLTGFASDDNDNKGDNYNDDNDAIRKERTTSFGLSDDANDDKLNNNDTTDNNPHIIANIHYDNNNTGTNNTTNLTNNTINPTNNTINPTNNTINPTNKAKWKGRWPVSFDIDHPGAFDIDLNNDNNNKINNQNNDVGGVILKTRRFSLQHKLPHNPFFWLQNKQQKHQKDQQKQTQQHPPQPQQLQQPHRSQRRKSSSDCGKVDLGPYAFKCSSKSDKELIYFISLLDILTHYGMRKRTAHTAKTVKHGPGAEISTVEPLQYAKRFMEFITKAFDA